MMRWVGPIVAFCFSTLCHPLGVFLWQNWSNWLFFNWLRIYCIDFCTFAFEDFSMCFFDTKLTEFWDCGGVLLATCRGIILRLVSIYFIDLLFQNACTKFACSNDLFFPPISPFSIASVLFSVPLNLFDVICSNKFKRWIRWVLSPFGVDLFYLNLWRKKIASLKCFHELGGAV